jgi:lipopolysaccharide transport system ATP-binding protein
MSSRSSKVEDLHTSGSSEHELVLELRNVGLCYRRGRGVFRRHRREFWAIEDISLRVRSGETLGVIGRNGAGKTTLLQILAGILKPDRGEFVNYGHEATLLSLQVGFVPHLSGRKNVVLSGLLLGLTLREIEEKMGSIIEFAELEGFVDEPIQTYSSGMRARLGFSTAFHVDPDVLLIDEVLGVGDAAFVEKSKAVMREKIRSDKTVVLVSHSVGSIRSLCDRAVWIDKRRVRMYGDPREVLDAYLEETQGGDARREGGARKVRRALEIEEQDGAG